MPEIPLGFSFDQGDDGFILRTKSADGTVTTIKMSEAELLGFKAQIGLWFDRKLSEIRAKSGSVQPIAAYPVARVRLLPDAIQENVLLTLSAPSGEQMTLSLPLPVADGIAAGLPDLLVWMRAAPDPMKQ